MKKEYYIEKVTRERDWHVIILLVIGSAMFGHISWTSFTNQVCPTIIHWFMTIVFGIGSCVCVLLSSFSDGGLLNPTQTIQKIKVKQEWVKNK